MIGAYIDPQVFLQLDYLVFFGFLAVVALIEIVSCGFPSIAYFLDIGKELTVGVGMIARGDAGLLVAGTGYAMDATPQKIYLTLVATCPATTIVSPFPLKLVRNHMRKQRDGRVSLTKKT